MKITEKYVFFYKEEFSQWYSSKFTDPISKNTFMNAEQFMMWMKAILFNDLETANKILNTDKPNEQKALGRLVKNFKADKWNANKFEIVCNASYLKFTQNPKLLCKLLETGNKILVEASPVDPIWGIGMAENEIGIENEENWRGENLLGYALTDTKNYILNLLNNEENLFDLKSIILNGTNNTEIKWK